MTKDGLSCSLGEHSGAQGHPCELEDVSGDIKVSSSDDQGNDAGVGNS